MRRTGFALICMLVIIGETSASATAERDWVRRFGTTGWEQANGVAVDPATGTSYVASSTSEGLIRPSKGGFDAVVHAIDANGDVLWARQFGTSGFDGANDVAADATGVYVLGSTNGILGPTRIGQFDAYLRKYTPDGAHLWTVQFGTGGPDLAWRVTVDASSAYVLGQTDGRFEGQQRLGERDMFLMALDSEDGATTWTRQFGTTRDDGCDCFAGGEPLALDGTSLYAAFSTLGRVEGQARIGQRDVVVERFETDGSPDWVRQFGTERDDAVSAITAGSGGVFVGGFTRGGFPGKRNGPSWDAYVERIDDATGKEIWTRQFGQARYQDVSGIVLLGSSLLVVGSSTGTVDGLESRRRCDVYVRSMDPADGSRNWSELLLGGIFDLGRDSDGYASTLVVVGEGYKPTSGSANIFVHHLTVT